MKVKNVMKIVFFTHYASMYGANLSLIYLIENLKSRYEIEPIVFLPKTKQDGLSEKLKKMNIESHSYSYYPWLSINNNFLKSYVKKILNLFKYKLILKKINKIHPDIIHCNSSIVDIGAKIGYKLSIPVVWHLREFGDLDYNLRYIYSAKYVSKMYSKVDTLIAISKAIKNKYNQIAPNSNIKVIYNGIKEIELNKLEHNKINFCIVGLVTKNKNQMELIKAGKILLDKGYKNFYINIIGSGDDNYIKDLKDYISENNLEDYVKFYGYQKDIYKILRYMDIGVMTSLNEAFGRVTVEYMFSGMPVIGSNSGGTPEIIEKNTTGFLYECGNEIELANYMEEYLKDVKLVEIHGANGRKLAEKKFNIEQNTNGIYQVYQEVLKRKRTIE